MNMLIFVLGVHVPCCVKSAPVQKRGVSGEQGCVPTRCCQWTVSCVFWGPSIPLVLPKSPEFQMPSPDDSTLPGDFRPE